MPHLLFILVIGLCLYIAYRWLCREFNRVDMAFRRTERRIKRKPAPSGTPLVFDPATGLYSPK